MNSLHSQWQITNGEKIQTHLMWHLMLSYYLYCNIVYITMTASNILKYTVYRYQKIDINQRRTKRFKSTLKMITLILRPWTTLCLLFTLYKLDMHIQYKGYMYIIYNCWLMSILFSHTHRVSTIQRSLICISHLRCA